MLFHPFMIIAGFLTITLLTVKSYLHFYQSATCQSRPRDYAVFAVLCCVLPIAIFLFIWALCIDDYAAAQVAYLLPNELGGLHRTIALSQMPAMMAGSIPVPSNLEAALQAYSVLIKRYDGYATIAMVTTFSATLVFVVRKIKAGFNARQSIERCLLFALFGAAIFSILSTIGIILSVLFETLLFFNIVSPIDFLFGTTWSPQIAMRDDQAGSSGSFGSLPLFTGTALISIIALGVAIPIGLISAMYLTEYASARTRNIAKPALEVLAGIPTVVYGFFAALIVAPSLQTAFGSAGVSIAAESALAAGGVMGIMLIPFISSLSDDALKAVPKNLYEGSLAMGATRLETLFKVMAPAALPGIVGGILLAASRAIGETMIVVMAAGLAANLTLNPLEAVTTVTVQIQSLLVGDQEFDNAKTLSAFALGFTLLLVTLSFNIAALYIVRKYRERYE